MLNIRWFTDVHIPPVECKDTIVAGVKHFVKATRKQGATLIINTGDDIDSSKDMASDRALQAQACALFSPLKGTLKIPGNHDVRHNLHLCDEFNFLRGGRITQYPDATVILWVANVTPTHIGKGPSGNFSSYNAEFGDIEWLKNALAGAREGKPVLLFTHVPFDMQGFEVPIDDGERNNPDRSYYRNNDKILEVLKNTPRRIFVFSGHRHVNRRFSFGHNLKMFTMDRLVRPFSKGPDRMEGMNYADIRVGNRKLEFQRSGVQPFEQSFRLA